MTTAKRPRPAACPDLDMTTLLEREHRAVDALFAHLVGAKGAVGRLRALAQLRDALAQHAASEESLFYRALRTSLSPEGHRAVSRAHEEHHTIKNWLAQLEATSPTAAAFDDLVAGLKAAVGLHVRDEERVLFPLAREVLGVARLQTLGERMLAARAPHRARKGR